MCIRDRGWNDDSAFDGLYESIPAWIGFMESHDEERAAYKQTQWGDEAVSYTHLAEYLISNNSEMKSVPCEP